MVQAAAVLLLALPTAWLSGFTVDDALIIARVAHQIASGHGYRFNPDGPVVDAVTPLGFAYLLAPFARSGPIEALAAGRLLGVACSLLAAGFLGRAVFESGTRVRRFLPLGLLATLTPLAAWASAGLETGLVTLLATLALGSSRSAWLAGGLAAGLRPELIPWAATLGVGRALLGADPARPRAWLGRVGWGVVLSLGPAVLVGAVRLGVFGTAAPLSVLAKPSGLEHGVRYALGALLLSGPPLLLLSSGLVKLAPERRLLLVAFGVHGVAMALSGGDWMALYRLIVPVLPSVLLLGALLFETERLPSSLLRWGLALVVSLVLAENLGPEARGVLSDRLRLIDQARAPLSSAKRVAALDVGWVGAATNARIVDLGGVTDPRVAVLAGGHTSKRIPRTFLDDRRVDALVLLLSPVAPGEKPVTEESARSWARAVESRVVRFAEDDFEQVAELELNRELSYVVLRRKNAP